MHILFILSIYIYTIRNEKKSSFLLTICDI